MHDSTEFKMTARSKPTYVVRAEKFRLDVQGGSSSSGRPCVSAGPIFLHAREIHAPASTELFLPEPGRVPNADSLTVGMHKILVSTALRISIACFPTMLT